MSPMLLSLTIKILTSINSKQSTVSRQPPLKTLDPEFEILNSESYIPNPINDVEISV